MLALDDRMISSLDTAAATIASSSAFLRHHSFGVLGAAGANVAGPIAGHLLRWEIVELSLRIAVSFSSSGISVYDGYYFIDLGSVANISADQHEAFLHAVEAAFPITGESTFTCAPPLNPEDLMPPLGKSEPAEPASQVVAPSRPPSKRPSAPCRMDTGPIGQSGPHAATIHKKRGKKGSKKRSQKQPQQPQQPQRHEQRRKDKNNRATPRPSIGGAGPSSSTSQHRTWVRSVQVSRSQ
jgi:hypothetical protein